MKTIKFRAWDGNKMYFPTQLINTHHNAITGYYDESGCSKGKIHELMQFTGLKDKNGVGIYEGDIKRWKFNNHDWLYVCYWSDIDCGFRWRLIKHNKKQPKDIDIPFENEEDYYNHVIKTNQRNNGFDSFSKIIGNIYENPELL